MQPEILNEWVTLYQADCMDVLPTLGKVDAVVTDPPYGVNYASGWNNKFRDVAIANDHDTTTRDTVLKMLPEVPAIVFGSWKQSKPEGCKTVLIWDKGTVGMGDLSIPWFPSTEEIYILRSGFVGSRVSSVLRYHVRNEYHPTEKPVALMSHLISRCPDGTILDPFAGSGTTGIAAMLTGRRCILIERDAKYCEVIRKRVREADAASPGKLFDPANDTSLFSEQVPHEVQK